MGARGPEPGTVKRPEGAGRKKGTPNRMTGELKQMILDALSEAGGVAYLIEQSEANPTAFMTLVGKVLPLTVSGDPKNPLVISWPLGKSKLDE